MTNPAPQRRTPVQERVPVGTLDHAIARFRATYDAAMAARAAYKQGEREREAEILARDHDLDSRW